ncbi:MAG TPA: hypothetical protein VFA46_00880 [Actinomycetes bacterium]|nr:hypothetical protein [Actinomycetes bacterium]
MAPVAESIPITVSTEIAVIALPTHYRRRRPEPRAVSPSGKGQVPGPRTGRKGRKPFGAFVQVDARYGLGA